MKKFAIISFPGTNCENESARAFRRHGMEAEIILWNEKGVLDESRCKEFDGYCIPGGFSYEDRGRSGIISAQEPIMEIIKKEAAAGKVILGICNGAQVLVETGLIPGYDNLAVGMGLGWNEMVKEGVVLDTGFRNQWAYLKNTAPKNRSAFNDFDELLHVPVANGEGRFVIPEALLTALEENDQILFRYSNKAGQVSDDYPTTPNGSMHAIAGICNPAGNILALMPHPERDPSGNGELIFESIRNYLEANEKYDSSKYNPLGIIEENIEVKPKPNYDVEIFTRLIITDNSERTIEEAFKRKGHELGLDRFEFFGINLTEAAEANVAIEKILNSGELANFNKHHVFVKWEGKIYQYTPQGGLTPAELIWEAALITANEKEFMGEAKKTSLNQHLGQTVERVDYGILWNIKGIEPKEIEGLLSTKILHNPYSMVVYHV